MSQTVCPLCDCTDIAEYHQDARRPYLQCHRCALVFVPAESHLTAEQEKAVYDQHENVVDDPGYRRFLSRLADPLAERLSGSNHGLDFGCGPGPALAEVMREKGHTMTVWDPYYFPEPQALTSQYDFVTCTEVVEHFNRPKQSWAQLMSLVKPGGQLGIMTKLVIDKDRFATWHYKNDPTHISFYCSQTLAFIGETYGKNVDIVDKDVILLG